MFCPQCRTEYREGYEECADCQVKLVNVLPADPQPDYVEFKPVLETYNQADISIIKSLLDAEQVTYYFQGEHLAIRPYGEPARLMVDQEQYAFAKELLDDLKLSYVELNLDDNRDREEPNES